MTNSPLLPQLAIVSGVYGAFFHVTFEQNPQVKYLAKTRGKLRIEYKKRNTGYQNLKEALLAVGDRVQVEPDTHQNDHYAIVNVEPRVNSIHRASFGRRQCLAANIDGVLVVTSYEQPDFNFGFIERCIAEAHLAEIPVSLIINKNDLRKTEPHEADLYAAHYRTLGIHVFSENLKLAPSNELTKHLQRGYFLLLGQSGTGKSTLLNKVFAIDLQEIGEISLIQKGRHTTTNPILLFSPKLNNLALIDVPGLREFGMQHRSIDEMRHAFPEFSNFTCRFDNCSHRKEPGCGVREAAEAGYIPLFRYQSYQSMIASLDENFRPRRGDYWRGIKQ